MAKSLDVYLHRKFAGRLEQDKGGRMIFIYDKTWVDNPKARPLSQSLPLRAERFTEKECRGFFGGILPEQSQRNLVARNLGISPRNDFSMLEKIGGECAGAVTFIPDGQALPERIGRYRDLSNEELVSILKSLPRRPLLAGDEDVRLSLAGAQEKVAVKVEGNQVSIPLDGAPSTHIIKPAHEHFEGLVSNESSCLQLAAAVGIPAARAQVRSVHGFDYALIERFDRKVTQTPNGIQYERLHQEDFCQALGIVPEQKYQNEGGPSLKHCFDLVREVSSTPVIDLQNLLNAIIFNFVIGNHDAHGKNFSLIYGHGDDVRFAPLYDLVCTIYYPQLSKKMAMKLGGEYELDKVSGQNFEKLADEAGLAKPLVRRRVVELAGAISDKVRNLDLNGSHMGKIADIIQERCKQTISDFGK